MSLLLNGSKTAVIAGTPLQMVEIYNGESYTFPMTFKDSSGAPVNINGWTLTTAAKWYTATLVYDNNTALTTNINLSNLTLLNPQPSQPAGLTAEVEDGPNGIAWLYIPSTINGGQTVGIDTAPALIAVVTITVTRTDALSSLTDVNKEPIGFIIRYI
jgi:hypothetical protein